MIRALLITVLSSIAISSVAPPPTSGGAEPRVPESRRQDAQRLKELRARWRSFSEEERQTLRRRFVELEKLPVAEREELRQRARRLDEIGRTLYRSLDEEARSQLDSLHPPKRREIVRGMATAKAKDLGRRVLAQLSSEERERFETATPEERGRLAREFRQRTGGQIDHVITELGPEFLAPAELERLGQLDDHQRRRTFLEIVKRRVVRRVDQRGLPPGFSPRHWGRMRDLSPPEFWLALERARRKHPDFDWRGELGRSKTGSDHLLQALRLDLDPMEHLALSHLPRAERGARMLQRKRAKALEVIRREGLVSDEELRRLETCPEPAFFLAVRRMLGADWRFDPPRHRGGKRRRGEQR